MTELEKALIAAKQFGGEAEANQLPSFSKDDRSSIAYHYGVEKWSDIPKDDQTELLLEYRKGEKLERAETFAEQVVTEYTLDWTPADWEGHTMSQLVKKCEEMLDGDSSLYSNVFDAKMAFERFMGWAI